MPEPVDLSVSRKRALRLPPPTCRASARGGRAASSRGSRIRCGRKRWRRHSGSWAGASERWSSSARASTAASRRRWGEIGRGSGCRASECASSRRRRSSAWRECARRSGPRA